jgi:hypothetical protein
MMAARKKTRAQDDVLTGEKFDAMTDDERAEVIAEIEAETPQQRLARSRPMNAEERAWWKRTKKKLAGRPKLGKHGAKIVSVTVEKDLLKQADAYAKANGMKRSELFAISVREKISA